MALVGVGAEGACLLALEGSFCWVSVIVLVPLPL